MIQIDQRQFLRDAMKELGMTRDGFAARFGFTRRALDSWLLPITSKGYRQMGETLTALREELALQRSSKVFPFKEGVLVDGYPVIDLMGTIFPTLFEETWRDNVLRSEIREYQNRDGKRTKGPVRVVTAELGPECSGVFSFRNRYDDSDHAQQIMHRKRTPLAHLDVERHKDIWVFITHHRTQREAHAYLGATYHQSAVFSGDDDDAFERSDACRYNGGYYTLFVRNKPPSGIGGLLIYETEKLLSKPDIYFPDGVTRLAAREEFEEIQAVMLPSGKLITAESEIEACLYQQSDSDTQERSPIIDPDNIWGCGNGLVCD